jgi:hypothetical protein
MIERTYFKFIESAMLQRLSSFRSDGDQPLHVAPSWEIGRRVSNVPGPTKAAARN